MPDFAATVQTAMTRSQNTTTQYLRDFVGRLRHAHNHNDWNLARRIVDEIDAQAEEIALEIATQASAVLLLETISVELGRLGAAVDALGRKEHYRRVLTIGLPFTINKEGRVMPFTLESNLFGFFPLRINGAAPPAGDTFSVTSNNADQFTAEMDVMPPEAAQDAGNPAVKVTCLRHDGMAGVSFTVNDSAGDTAAAETFDIVAPKAPPPPPGVITINEAGIATHVNPNPPAA